jgi:hypothetical protein
LRETKVSGRLLSGKSERARSDRLEVRHDASHCDGDQQTGRDARHFLNRRHAVQRAGGFHIGRLRIRFLSLSRLRSFAGTPPVPTACFFIDRRLDFRPTPLFFAILASLRKAFARPAQAGYGGVSKPLACTGIVPGPGSFSGFRRVCPTANAALLDRQTLPTRLLHVGLL